MDKTRSDVSRLINTPVQFTVGTRGRSRELLLEEPPLVEVQALVDRELDRLIEVYRENRAFFDGLVEGQGTSVDLRGLLPFIRQFVAEICAVAEICDSAEKDATTHSLADIISLHQLLQLVLILADVINLQELKQAFDSALAATGISLSPKKEKAVPGDSLPAH